MTEQPPERINGNPMKMFGVILPLLPGMIFRFGGSFLRFKGVANKAGSVFHRELLSQGLDETTAKRLTEEYLKGSRLRSYLGAFR